MANFLVRLRGTADGIVDLAGNEWVNTGGVTVSSTQLVTNGHAMSFSLGSYLYTYANNKLTIPENHDFTISLHVKTASDSHGYPTLFCAKTLSIGYDGDYGQRFYFQYNNNGYPAYYPHRYGYTDLLISDIPVQINTAYHFALVRKDNLMSIYINGVCGGTKLCSDEQIFGLRECMVGYAGVEPELCLFSGELDDICLIDEAVWTENFTPPTSYLNISPHAYLSSNSLYTGTSLTNLTNNWSGLTNAEKEALVPSFSREIPSIQDLASISPFRVLTDDTSSANVKVTGQPKPQTIEPTSLINTGAVSTVQSINITNTITDATVKFAITTDLTTYKVYDATQGAWVTSTNIEEDGMSIAQINALTPQILALLDVSNGVAFKQCFIGTSENASAELSEISAVVDIDGSWSQSVHGTDYSVSYPNKTTMSVRLLTNGDYIINYPISSNS